MAMPKASFRLTIELIPGPLWGRNLRSREGIGPWRWRKLRQSLINERGDQCAICRSRKKPHGHEIWGFHEMKRVGTATLKGVEIICQNCHDIHHWGRTKALINAGFVDTKRHNELKRHFRKVNRCTQREFDIHAKLALRIWREQSFKKWNIDWGDFHGAVAEAEAARNLWWIRRSAREQKAAGTSMGAGIPIMKQLPPRLFEMSQQGANEDEIQLIFDALIYAEENGRRFVNVYQNGEATFLFSNDQMQADQQLRMWVERTGRPAIGFVRASDTWEVR
jgi:hypothetical protein